jgi:hypothetical protein
VQVSKKELGDMAAILDKEIPQLRRLAAPMQFGFRGNLGGAAGAPSSPSSSSSFTTITGGQKSGGVAARAAP